MAEVKDEEVAAAMVMLHNNRRVHKRPKEMGVVHAEESGAVADAAAARRADRSRQRRSGRWRSICQFFTAGSSFKGSRKSREQCQYQERKG